MEPDWALVAEADGRAPVGLVKVGDPVWVEVWAGGSAAGGDFGGEEGPIGCTV